MLAAISTSDVEAIVRLLGGVAGTSDSIAVKKRTLIDGLSRLIESDAWLWVTSKYDPETNDMMAFAIFDGGWQNPAQKAALIHETSDPEALKLVNAPMLEQLHRAGSHITRTRQDLIPETIWSASKQIQEYHIPVVGLDQFMMSLYPLPGRTISALGLHRKAGKPAFSDRERTIVHTVFSQVEWLHLDGTNVPARDSVLGLSRRERDVLLMLLGGDGKKQIANKLQISEHTVGDHMKRLHKHFNVSSRGELLAKFMAGDAAATNVAR